MLPTITIDNATCLGPLTCGQCLQTCPMMVFIAGPTKKWKFRETDPKDYQVYARYYDQCITCSRCVEVCPVDAITVEIAESQGQGLMDTVSAAQEGISAD